MDNKPSNLLFIDRNNYVNILDKNFSLTDLVDCIYGYKNTDRLSALTTMIILEINDKLVKAFFDQGFYHPNKFSIFNRLSNHDHKYVGHYVKDTLTKQSDNCVVDPCGAEKKYYELIPLANNDILVVFEEAFFEIITESKDKLQQFVLDCLCYQYKFSSNLELLMKLYLSLQVNETALNMVKLRFN